VTLGAKTLDQAQNLPLPAAHLSSGIDVENLHERYDFAFAMNRIQLMFRALAYFRKV
jgi:hypothetical protein